MNAKLFLFVLLSVILSSQSALGQSGNSGGKTGQVDSGVKDQISRDIQAREQALKSLNGSYSAKKPVIIIGREQRAENLTDEQKQIVKAALTVNPVDEIKYKEFLKQPNTGLIRLLPNHQCFGKYTVKVDGDCAEQPLIGQFYSFREQTHMYKSPLFDLLLQNGVLFSGESLAHTILTKLGDVDLGSVSLSSDGVKFLAAFVPKTGINDFSEQQIRFNKGLIEGDYRFSQSEKALLNETYALRIIAYSYDEKIKSKYLKSKNPQHRMLAAYMESGRRDDIIVAFRVVRQDADGSLTILWKELNRQKAPKITFQKNEYLSGVN